MTVARRMRAVGLACTLLLAPGVALAAALDIATVRIGNAGNGADPRTGQGAVGYDYYIAVTETTNADYVAFLNAVDPGGNNPRDVYNRQMSSQVPVAKGGIDFDPLAGAGQKYRTKPFFANKPVNYVSFFDAARFSNWVMTGDSETGFYQLDGVNGIAGRGQRGVGGYVAVADLNEWYKAAYHANDGVTDRYFLFPTGGDTQPTAALATASGDIANPGANVANFGAQANWNGSEGGGVFEELGNVTSVGSAGAGSAYGTFDQGGNVLEWNDAPVGTNKYVMRGGSLWLDGEFMASTVVSSYLAHLGGSSLGFRLVSLAPIVKQVVPLPAPGALLCLALGGLAAWRYPRHPISTHA
jgi:sulfatase modifying factor 1